MKPINVYYTEGKYQTRNWKAEKTYKYVFEFEDGYVELGYFIHFADQEMTHYVDHVIELSSSIGCAMKCAFCASSEIENIRSLTAQEIFDMFYYIYQGEVQRFSESVNLVVSFLGIGDLLYTMNNVLAAMEMIYKVDSSILFNLSSCFWTPEMLKRIGAFKLVDNVKTVQVTYVSTKIEIIRQLIRGLPEHTFDFGRIITDMTSTFPQRKIRINYLVIKGINDSKDDFCLFADMIKGIEARVYVRISKLNTTAAASANNLLPSEISRMTELMRILENIHVEAYLFYSHQDDKMNCGQLITEGNLPVV
ncbi:MAG: hypothetical protein HDR13_00065 [Lachnospiraceae bacterium]|nr:hypothetical protein [Lachnospiraceae bacterium]